MKLFKDGTILLYKPQGKPNLVQKLIQKITQSPWTHAALYIDGHTWDADWPEVQVLKGLEKADLYLEPIDPLNPQEYRRMLNYVESAYGERWQYNAPKLFVLALVYPLRKFFSWLGWVPFDKWIYGEVCSGFVAEAWRSTLRMDAEGWEAPGDLFELKQFLHYLKDPEPKPKG